jgi:CheY-like chemotaxis protein
VNRTLLIATIVTITLLVAAFDFRTSAELVGSILFSFPLALCALQHSKWVLWGTATATVFLTVATEFWGFHRMAMQNPLVPSVNRGILVASLFTLALLIHFWIEKSQRIVLNAAEIEIQSARLATQNVELERLVTTATRDISIRKETEMHLAELKESPALKSIPVVILTTSASETDIRGSYDHANRYITKPVDLDGFLKVVKNISSFWLSVVKLPRVARA